MSTKGSVSKDGAARVLVEKLCQTISTLNEALSFTVRQDKMCICSITAAGSLRPVSCTGLQLTIIFINFIR